MDVCSSITRAMDATLGLACDLTRLDPARPPVYHPFSLLSTTDSTRVPLVDLVDLSVVYGFGIVPFSRVNPDPGKGGREIFQHHVPALVAGTMMGAPWIFQWPFADSRLGLLQGARALEMGTIVLRWRAWTALSCFNETLMCFQRVDTPAGIFNSRVCYSVELLWKVCIFTVNAGMGAIASILVLTHIVASCAEEAAAPLGAARCVAASPLAMSVPAYLLFYATMYPSMAQRAIRRLRDVLGGHVFGTPPGAPACYPRNELRAKAA